MKKIVVIAGKSNVASLSLLYISKKLKKDYELYVIPSKTDLKDHGWQLSLRKMANDIGCKIINDLYVFSNEKNLLFFSLEYDSIINVKKFKSKKLFNIHFSLLPTYRGVYTSIFPILNGEKYSGVTLHLINEGIDSGDIIDQTKFKIDGLTSFELYQKYNYEAFKLFKKNITKILNGTYKTFKQDNSKASYYSRKDLDFSIGNLKKDLIINKNVEEIDRILKAFYFPVYQYPKFENQNIKRWWIIEKVKHNKYNNIIKFSKNFFLLNLKNGKILIEVNI